VELTQVLFTGALAGCLAGALNAALTPLLARGKANAHEPWREQTLVTQIATLAIHLCAGVGFALLFWLSWGLAAVGGVPWWQRGLLFALLVWSATCLPLALAQWLALRLSAATALSIAAQWLTTSIVVSLACSWTWSKGP